MNTPQPQNSADTLSFAVAWGKRGRAVFPCWPVHPITKICCCPAGSKCNRKHPVLSGGHNAASTDPQAIFELWTAAREYMRKVAWKTRREQTAPDPAIGGSSAGLIIFDMDRPDALTRFAAIAGEDGMALAHVVLSGLMDDGVNRGVHAAYLIPEDVDPAVVKRLTIWSVGDGLDGRTNGKGFTILPPSLHRTGVAYEVAQDREPGECPPQLVALALEQIAQQADSRKKPRETSKAPAVYRGPPPPKGTWLWKAGCGEDLLWSERDEYRTKLVERALDIVDPERGKGLTGRPSLSYDLWRDVMWSLRAWEQHWADGWAEQLAFAWSRQFASHDERVVRETVWNYHGKEEVGRGRLLQWADKLMLGWRQLFDSHVRAAYGGTEATSGARATAEAVIEAALAGTPAAGTPAAGTGAEGAGTVGAPLAKQPLHVICAGAGIIVWPVAHRDGSAIADVRNVDLAFRQWGVTLAYDLFTRKKWAFFRDNSRRPIDDAFVSEAHDRIGVAGMRIGLSEFRNYLNGIAYRIKFDLAKDWLASLPAWDGVELAARLFVHVFGCPDDEYHRQVGRLFAAQLVRRILQPGYKSDHMIVLKSDEGLGKSTFFSKIVPYEFFSENLTFAADEKKIIEQTAGSILCETPELINITRQQVEHCKHFISRRIDRSRLAYGHETEDVPRRFTMVGTTNDAKPLQSRTGNRRFIIVEIHQMANLAWVEENFSQLWAEFIQIEKTFGFALDLPKGLKQEAMVKQDAAVDYGPSEEALADAIAEIKNGFISHTELYRFLGLANHREAEMSSKLMRAAKAVFVRAGWRPHRLNTARGHMIGVTLEKYVCEIPGGNALEARFVLEYNRLNAQQQGAIPLSTVEQHHALGTNDVLKDGLGATPRAVEFKGRINGKSPFH